MTPAALFAAGLLAGLVAGTASCTAVQGGLLIDLARRPARSDPAEARTSGSPGSAAVVAAFIGGRLASHTLAGALLGLLGDAVRLPPPARAVLLMGAGTAVIVFAVRVARNAGARPACSPGHDCTASAGAPPGTDAGRTPEPRGTAMEEDAPTRPGVMVRLWGMPRPEGRRAARSWVWGVARPSVLGAVTVLIPCGVTLSTEAVAVSTGSWLGGAAVMAGFVTGTAPGFALLGLLVRRVATRRLATLAAAGALLAGAVTVVAGLRLGGWAPDVGGSKGAGDQAAAAVSGAAASALVIRPDGTQVLTIWSTDRGYRPGVAAIEAGRPTEIVFRTSENHGCTRALTIQGQDITLPVTGQQTVRLAPQPSGRLRYVCGMGMYVGFIDINKPLSSGVQAVSTDMHQGG
ncbi:sulfite exporter TauE/SafE family protein [Sphaerisporangium perillae]|uniref:sulfite exporter TauE/SafE family protein n=1 Tax=Sphaerisporangium perillae TaxID=2935860 RepID=UPI002010A15B|nr:sulfite exporter TauE/SafE family protein [Sphaerisporangium perillae]